MRKIVISILFLLGVAELAWSINAAVRYHIMGPEFAKAFDVSKLTADQQQVLGQLEDIAKTGWSFAALFGLVTILIAIFFWTSEIAKKPDA